MLTGFLASCAGLILIARTNSAKADYGLTYTLQAILVAILGGTNPSGGFGTVIGVVLAVFLCSFCQAVLITFKSATLPRISYGRLAASGHGL